MKCFFTVLLTIIFTVVILGIVIENYSDNDNVIEGDSNNNILDPRLFINKNIQEKPRNLSKENATIYQIFHDRYKGIFAIIYNEYTHYPRNDTLYIAGDFTGYAQGEKLDFCIQRIGSYHYETVKEEMRTIKAYTITDCK